MGQRKSWNRFFWIALLALAPLQAFAWPSEKMPSTVCGKKASCEEATCSEALIRSRAAQLADSFGLSGNGDANNQTLSLRSVSFQEAYAQCMKDEQPVTDCILITSKQRSGPSDDAVEDCVEKRAPQLDLNEVGVTPDMEIEAEHGGVPAICIDPAPAPQAQHPSVLADGRDSRVSQASNKIISFSEGSWEYKILSHLGFKSSPAQ